MNRVLISLLLFIVSCDNFYKDEELISNFENNLKISFSLENEFEENNHFTDGKVITRPAGSWQNLISSESVCLNYRIPNEKSTGALQIVKKKRNDDCPELPVDKEISSIDGISNFKITFTTDHLQGKFVRNRVYGLVMDYRYLNKKRSLKLVLPNKIRKKSYVKSRLVKYSSSGTFRLDKGVRITDAAKKRNRVSLWSSGWELEGDYEINFCEKKSKKCEIIGNVSCDECLYGWEYLVDYNCEGGGSKACSPVKCGQKGRPACPRGVIWYGKNLSDLCFDDSPAGFCQDELRVICGEDGVLICV